MGYHSLSECTLSDDERWQEKNRLVRILSDAQMTTSDCSFVDKMKSSPTVSVAQLFWLRDLRDRYS
jgi:hypothetical protein